MRALAVGLSVNTQKCELIKIECLSLPMVLQTRFVGRPKFCKPRTKLCHEFSRILPHQKVS